VDRLQPKGMLLAVYGLWRVREVFGEFSILGFLFLLGYLFFSSDSPDVLKLGVILLTPKRERSDFRRRRHPPKDYFMASQEDHK
jgi:hypothetical protein